MCGKELGIGDICELRLGKTAKHEVCYDCAKVVSEFIKTRKNVDTGEKVLKFNG